VNNNELAGPDLTAGISASAIADGASLLGHAHGEAVLLVRRASEFFAVGATCTHWSGPLADGLVVGDTVRCPWHHACFSLRTGEALRAPALDAIACFNVELGGGMVRVGAKRESATPRSTANKSHPESVVIVGGGAAGTAAAEMLRRLGYAGRITMLSADSSPPCDRPNLSKGYLTGAAPAEYMVLRPPAFYEEQRIDLKLGARVTKIDAAARRVTLADGSHHSYGALLLATGAEPIRLDIPGANLPHVHTLRTMADGEALVGAAQKAKRAVVIGSSFIGLEVAASLRAREIAVDVVAPEAVPMLKVLGEQAGTFIRALHEQHGVTFHLGTTAASIDATHVTLKNGERLPAELVVVGIGVRPSIALAEQAGLAIDRGVVVNEYMETSVAGIFAAGDIARWPDRLTGERLRVEHWVVAERQGQTAARNILGRRERFDAVPFFWSEQYDFGFSYIGNAPGWDQADIDGQLNETTQDCTITYRRAGKKLAVVVVHRDLEGLKAEVELERAIAASA
jgi:NADPH-dependent 2,4-dienoyl-CoA reductase/sulfur reductase-like enzyme/nitrite reductase/ring-hydroxylating ferredoxin subunit